MTRKKKIQKNNLEKSNNREKCFGYKSFEYIAYN